MELLNPLPHGTFNCEITETLAATRNDTIAFLRLLYHYNKIF